MITCTNCGRDNEDEYKYCLGCGSVLPKPEEQAAKPEEPEMIDCPHCGTKVPSNFKFCGACGGSISAPAPMTTDAPQGSPVATQSDSAPNGAETQKSEAATARLVVIKPDGTEGASIPLQGGVIELGRSSDFEALSSDPFLSPVHAKLEPKDSGFLVSDAGSLNGVFLRISSEVELSDGDHIRIGQELLEYREFDSYESAAPDDKTLTGGSPDHGNWGRLGLIAGPDVETRAFTFSSDEVTLGREIGDIVFRDDGFVSGKHARIAKVEGKVFLKDLGSSNGTYVRIRQPRTIDDGDLILMGQQLFRLEA